MIVDPFGFNPSSRERMSVFPGLWRQQKDRALKVLVAREEREVWGDLSLKPRTGKRD
ncbi:hypothetical protein [Phenylobacterium sp. 58.2.17]|uniref:hypothetical protein n=1 Tax=Phenylobacterium sp. 58.2.17 TaxID=2969306 RepID=UPI0022647849|nr:hypothetical protein [Phenylobacterium sp. 58.2.17]MCX7585031.1 hypothetical protein [Phenylobacterium sp. 58.2.17]